MAKVTPAGMSQADLVALLAALQASINGITAKLDADAGVTDTNYSSLWGLGTTRVTATQPT